MNNERLLWIDFRGATAHLQAHGLKLTLCILLNLHPFILVVSCGDDVECFAFHGGDGNSGDVFALPGCLAFNGCIISSWLEKLIHWPKPALKFDSRLE